jgi:AMMECR1 domain-containing protein
MHGHKRAAPRMLMCLIASFPATPALAAAAPDISEPNRKFLSRLARRALQDSVRSKPIYQSGYVPAALREMELEVVVRLRQDGYLRGDGVGGPAPLAEAVRDAALAALGAIPPETAVDIVNDLLIEIEVVGSPEPIPFEGDWTRPRALDAYIEPGVHGLVFQSRNVRRRFCPTELATSDLIVAQAVETIAQQIQAAKPQIVDMALFKFRTAHWYEPGSGAPIVSLHRGLTIIPPSAVTADGLDQTIERIADYMAYRQLKSGLFRYEYRPSRDVYDDQDNLVRQAGAVASMAIHASWSGKSASRAAADMGIRAFTHWLADVPSIDGAAFIATPDGEHKLGVTALTGVALARHPDPSAYATSRRKLVKGMLWLQRPSGMFITAFPPAERLSGQEYYPGEALLAMAMDYELEPSAEVLEAFDRAIAYYRATFRGEPAPPLMPWQVQAYAIMAEHTKRRDYVDYVFELCDWLAEKQLVEGMCEWPEMWGGIAAYQADRAGVSTAAYLEGFADGLKLARRVGDQSRAERYERVVRAAARFVMQLQIRPEEAYYIRSPRDAVWGIRTSPSLNLLRIDHDQHALVGLIKARDVLFGRSE